MINQSCVDLRVLRITETGGGQFYEMVLEDPGWGGYDPGQFLMVRPKAWATDPLLPRPISIADVDEEGVHLFVQRLGRGTALLTSSREGDMVTAWGPLGRGFRLTPGQPTLLLAGGIGIAPFVGMARRFAHKVPLSLLFGHRVERLWYPVERIAAYIAVQSDRQENMEEIFAFVERVNEAMRAHAGGMVCACGPTPFLAAVQRTARKEGIAAQLSIEKRMACGIGACLGCVVEKEGEGLVQACTRGPVFFADEIALLGGAA